MNTENLCAKIGCPAACCKNVEMKLTPDEIARFTHGKPVHTINPEDYISLSDFESIPSIAMGITIIEDTPDASNTKSVLIKGYCPHLNLMSMDCTAKSSSARPNVCSEMPQGAWYCTGRRKKLESTSG